MLKKTFFQIHWFLGITAGLILSLMGVTGAIYSYEQQILKWMNQDSYTVQVENREKLNPAEIYQHFYKTDPALKINSITIASAASESSSINVVKEGARRGFTMMINPYNAELLPDIKGREFFAFIQQLHRNLTVGPVGKQITGACALMLIFFVLSGLYLRWPKKHTWRQWLAVKPKLKGRNFIWDLHAVVGTWVIIFYLIFAMTGLYWSYDWWRNGMFKVLGVERPQATVQERPNANSGRQGQAEQNIPQPNQMAGRDNRNSNAASTRPENAQPTPNASGSNESRSERRRPKGLESDQIQNALNQTWRGFTPQLNREYSSLTFNLPKKDDGKLELTFVDAIPQHERARNKAIFNYQTAQIESLELYEDKKLNEQIMSSMLPVHRGSFMGPVYQFIAMLAALAMPLFFVTGWMLYLKRRKQKKLTLAAKQGVLHTEIDPNATPWLIAYATQTGVSEQLAWRTATSLQQARQPVTVKSVQQLTEDDLKENKQILFVASTYGTGEAPDLATSFDKKILSLNLDLSHLQYAILALGSQEYPDSYCSFGHKIDTWLKKNHAHALFNTIEVNNADNLDIEKWNNALAKVSNLELQAMSIDKVFDQWKLLKRNLLNPNSQGAPAFNIELQAKHQADWQAGDIAEIQPGNSQQRIEAFLAQHQISAQTQVDSLNINIAQALWNKNLNTVVEPFANMDHLLEQLPDLPTREYSIASIPQQQVLRLVVRQQSNAQGDLGLGSGWLTQHLSTCDEISLRIRTNESFHLIHDNRPIICIGNGTGIAGLMSLISARIRSDYTENWLIFGEREQANDFFYKETIQAWQNTGMLKRIDLAFSRDQLEKVYVHHKLREHAEELKTWIANDAVLYVCGSIQGMASDVDQALIDILGETCVDDLRQTGRYRRDVY